LARATFRGRIIDVREPAEFHQEAGHLAGAELVPLATVAEQASRWDRDLEFVMVCRSGGRSGRAAQLLANMGFRHLYNLAGGMLAHVAAGLPTVRS
jgi:rhodanese-related sulfurtransferase